MGEDRRLKQVFVFRVITGIVFSTLLAFAANAEQSCTDEASLQQIKQQIADKQQQAKAWDSKQREELLTFLASEKRKNGWSEPKVQQILANMLIEKEFIAFEEQKKPHTSALIKIIRELRSSKEGERDLKMECSRVQQMTEILETGLKVNQQQYAWMRAYIQQAK